MTLTRIDAGLVDLLSNTSGPSVWFRDNLDVSFFGSNMLCSFATLTAKKLISLNGLTATCGRMSWMSTPPTPRSQDPCIVNGTLTGTGITSLLGPYATSTAVNAKENSITVVSPLVKTVGTGVNQLSLDTTAAYTLGTLNVTGASILHTSSFGDVAIVDSTGADILRFTDDGFISFTSASNMRLSPTSAGGLILLSSNRDLVFGLGTTWTYLLWI